MTEAPFPMGRKIKVEHFLDWQKVFTLCFGTSKFEKVEILSLKRMVVLLNINERNEIPCTSIEHVECIFFCTELQFF